MTAYQYTALQKNGKNCKGILEADSERHARELLKAQNLLPIELVLLKKQIAASKKDKLKSDELSLLTRQLATLVAAGIPIDESLKGVAEQAENATTKKLIIAIRAKVMEGFGLAQAMATYPNAFPELYRATLAAGEKSSRLDLVLEKLADYTENLQSVKQKIQQALIYPTLMIIVSFSIISFLLAFVVPKIIDVFANFGQSLPIMTVILIHVSNFIKHYGILVLVLMGLLSILFFKAIKIPNYKIKWHGFLLKLPIISNLIVSINVARYIKTFGILFSAGVSILETMRVSASVINNVVIQDSFNKASIQVKEGTNISVALKNTNYIKSMAAHLIQSGEKSGQIAVMMERAANSLDSEVKRVIDTSLTLLEPLIILLMGAVVLFIVLATLLPIFSMEQLGGM
ncbi:MAG: type II secretion system protein GspF [Legionellales bacterium RIFCSPHIGHO2_12_FULL_35_11]|nr:MAG: type II secretion system protein GspF [Legionellales bacterium RIFCSPHIGHO2_12_FULL_35_11]